MKDRYEGRGRGGGAREVIAVGFLSDVYYIHADKPKLAIIIHLTAICITNYIGVGNYMHMIMKWLFDKDGVLLIGLTLLHEDSFYIGHQCTCVEG